MIVIDFAIIVIIDVVIFLKILITKTITLSFNKNFVDFHYYFD